MTTNELKEMADLYFDNELDRENEPLLFSSLALDDEGREYFFSLNVIRTAIQKDTQPFPAILEQRIFSSLKQKSNTSITGVLRSRIFGYVSAAAAAVFIIITLILFSEIRDYRYRLDAISGQMDIQNKTISLILNNSLPPAEVRGMRVNEIIVKANL